MKIMVNGKPQIQTMKDGWTLSTRDGSWGIQHEHTLLITETGYEVLSLRPGEIVPN